MQHSRPTLRSRIRAYLIAHCEHRQSMLDHDGYYCQIKYDNRCRNTDTFFVEYPDCPDTCPHHVRNVRIWCDDNEKCRLIDKKTKELLKIIDGDNPP